MRKGVGARWGVLIAAAFLSLPSLALGAREQAVVRLWNWNVHDKKYQQKMYKLFNQRHPEIKIEYSSISNTVYAQTLEAAFVANEPPELFYPAGKLTFNYLRTHEMIMSLDRVAPNAEELKAWMAAFPSVLHKFVEGVNTFGGKPYLADLAGDSYNGDALFGNLTLFKEAGISKMPATQGELRGAAAKITESGQGKYFGIVHGLRYRPGAWDQDVRNGMAWAAGAQLFDRRDGKHHYYSPEFMGPLKTWIGMREDGSVFPGELQMEDEAAKMAMATNKAGLFFGGPWVPANLMAYNPDVQFDVALAPTPDDGIRRQLNSVGVGGAATGTTFGYVVPASVKNPAAVWEVIKFLSSVEYQSGYVQGGYGISYLPEANRPENFAIRQMYKFVEWYTDPSLWRTVPAWPEGALKTWDFMPGIYPPFEDVMDNIYLGKAGFETLKEMDKRLDDALDVAIQKARESGIPVTRQDFIVADWDPSKDYAPRKK